MVFVELSKAGFDGSEPGALNRLEAEVVDCASFPLVFKVMNQVLNSCTDVKALFGRAHELANLANRSSPIVTDLLLACKERNVEPEQLEKITPGYRSKKRKPSGVRLLSVPFGT